MSSDVIESPEQPAPGEQELDAPPDQAATQGGTTQDDDDADSALDPDDASSTTSAKSSIYKFRHIGNRTYHAEVGEAQYWGCNDDKQNEVLDIFHKVFYLMADEKLHYAPIDGEHAKKVLDIGTGTGIWAMDFADEFVNAEVIGTDISPIQPSFVPPNLQFQVDDCTEQWTFDENSIDYIHIRWLNGSVQEWRNLFRDAYRCLKPGGYVESCELSARIESDDDSVAKESMVGRWGDIFKNAGEKLGRSFAVIEDGLQRKGMDEAGFVDIEEKNEKIPVGTWPQCRRMKKIGAYALLAMTEDPEGFLTIVLDRQGWKTEEISVTAAHFRGELKDSGIHGYIRQKIVWGRKEN